MEDIKYIKEKIKHFKVLFVDDEEDIRVRTGSFLEKFFDNVQVCANGKEGLEYFKENQDVDIVISDIRMPKMDGMQMAQAIKDLKDDIYIIFVTASRSIEYDNDLISDLYIKKPLSFDDLKLILKKISEL